MRFRIADTFTESLARLTGEQQRAAKTTAFDLQINPAQPGMKFHRVDGAKDKNFWSVRVGRGLRLVVHKTASNFLLCYVGEHDESYRWAERRRLERHPNTGAAQLVEIREVVRDIEVPRYVTAEPAASPVFSGVADNQLLDYGVPAEWLDEVKEGDRRRCPPGGRGSPSGGGRRGFAGTCHRHHAGTAGPCRPLTRTRSPIPMRSAASG